MAKSEKRFIRQKKTRWETGKAPFGLQERLAHDAGVASLHCDKSRSGQRNGTSCTVSNSAIQAEDGTDGCVTVVYEDVAFSHPTRPNDMPIAGKRNTKSLL